MDCCAHKMISALQKDEILNKMNVLCKGKDGYLVFLGLRQVS